MNLKHMFFLLLLLTASLVSDYPLLCQITGNSHQRISSVSCVPSKLITEAERLNQNTNGERFNAVISLLKEHDLDFTVQSFTASGSQNQLIQGKNIVLSTGTGKRNLAVGAHYDAAPLDDGSVGPGMIDNAAGVIVLIHVAEAFKNLDLGCRILFVLFDQEEGGLLGSKHFVKSTASQLIEAMINIDIVGYGDTIIFGPVKGNEGTKWRTIRRVCDSLDLDAIPFPNYPAGDNLSFESAGIPSISIGVLPSLEAHRVWIYMNDPKSPFREGFVPSILKVIHTKNDTAEKLQGSAMISARDVIIGVLKELTDF